MALRTINEIRTNHDQFEGVTLWADDASKTAGGAPRRYIIDLAKALPVVLEFQSRPFDPVEGVDGLTNETLLCVVLDRLRGFQKGQFPCRENAIAITAIEEALLRLQDRSRRLAAQRAEMLAATSQILVSDGSPPVLDPPMEGNTAT